jgi:hypothetical protein
MDSCTPLGKNGLHDFARMDRGAIDRPAEEILHGKEPIADVKVDQTKSLVIARTEPRAQKFACQ